MTRYPVSSLCDSILLRLSLRQRPCPHPLFVIADDGGVVIGAEETKRLFRAAAEPKRYWLIPGADHARGWQTAPEECERRVLSFLHEALGA